MQLTDVSVSYRERARIGSAGVSALTDVSLAIGRGEKVGIIGANGAGKSTLLRVMAGVIRPNGGTCDAEGMSTSLLSLSAGFDPELSGTRNIVMHGMLMGLTKQEATVRIPDIVEASGLGDAIHRRVSTYSNGMRARLCFWTAINLGADLMLIDEVLAVGDAEFRRKSQQAMESLFTGNTAVVLVSHNIGVMRRFCDRVIWLEQGRSVRDGKSRDVIEAYMAASANGAAVERSERKRVFVSGSPGVRPGALGDLLNGQPDIMVGVDRLKLPRFREELDQGCEFFAPCRFSGWRDRAAKGAAAKAVTPELVKARFEGARVVGEVVPRLHRCVSEVAVKQPDAAIVFLFSGPLDVLPNAKQGDVQFDEAALRKLRDWNASLAAIDRVSRAGTEVVYASRERLFGADGEAVFERLLERLGASTRRVTGKAKKRLEALRNRSAAEQEQLVLPDAVRAEVHRMADIERFHRLLAASV